MRNYIWTVRVRLRTIGSDLGGDSGTVEKNFNIVASSISAAIFKVSHKGDVVKVVRGTPVDYVVGEGSGEVEK